MCSFSPLQIWYSLNFNPYSTFKLHDLFFASTFLTFSFIKFFNFVSLPLTSRFLANQTLFQSLIISKCVGYTLILPNLNFKLLPLSFVFSFSPLTPSFPPPLVFPLLRHFYNFFFPSLSLFHPTFFVLFPVFPISPFSSLSQLFLSFDSFSFLIPKYWPLTIL